MPAQKKNRKPKLAIWKFSSCDGCQLSLLDCEEELLAITDHIEIANFPEASRAVAKGPYDISLVEGSITTPHDAERIHQVRRQSKVLITIGACATAGGIQALRNFKDVKQFVGKSDNKWNIQPKMEFVDYKKEFYQSCKEHKSVNIV